jgi:hypothetical protein
MIVFPAAVMWETRVTFTPDLAMSSRINPLTVPITVSCSFLSPPGFWE